MICDFDIEDLSSLWYWHIID